MSLVSTFAPYEDESGFGYYRRLAAKNLLWGWKELAGVASIHRSRSALMARPEHIAAALGLDVAWSKRACEQEQIARTWRGLHRGQTEAVCPACLQEAVYLRQCWEHAYVTSCSAHRVRLVDRCHACGDRLHTKREHIEFCACGYDLRESSTCESTQSEQWLSVLIASDGVSSGRLMPKLRRVQVNTVCNLVRTLCLYFDPHVPPSSKSAGNVKTIHDALELLKPMESLLANWPLGFEQHVSERLAAGNSDARTLNQRLGSWYIMLRKYCQNSPLEPFLELIIKVAAREFDGLLGLDSATQLVVDETQHVRRPEAAKLIGISQEVLVRAGQRKEYLFRHRLFGTRGVVYEIPMSEIERIIRARKGWISEREAARRTGVGKAVLKQMVQAGVISSDINWRHDLFKAGPVEEKSIDALYVLLEKNVKVTASADENIILWAELMSRRMGDSLAIQSVMRAARDGELIAIKKGFALGEIGFLRSEVAKYFGTPVREAGMTVGELSKATGWKPESISHWMSQGFLKFEEVMLKGRLCRVVLPQHLLEFGQAYIPLADLAKVMHTRASVLSRNLNGVVEFVGALPMKNGARRGCLIRLTDVMRLAVAQARNMSA